MNIYKLLLAIVAGCLINSLSWAQGGGIVSIPGASARSTLGQAPLPEVRVYTGTPPASSFEMCFTTPGTITLDLSKIDISTSPYLNGYTTFRGSIKRAHISYILVRGGSSGGPGSSHYYYGIYAASSGAGGASGALAAGYFYYQGGPLTITVGAGGPSSVSGSQPGTPSSIVYQGVTFSSGTGMNSAGGATNGVTAATPAGLASASVGGSGGGGGYLGQGGIGPVERGGTRGGYGSTGWNGPYSPVFQGWGFGDTSDDSRYTGVKVGSFQPIICPPQDPVYRAQKGNNGSNGSQGGNPGTGYGAGGGGGAVLNPGDVSTLNPGGQGGGGLVALRITPLQ